jgi:hypothetical protein
VLCLRERDSSYGAIETRPLTNAPLSGELPAMSIRKLGGLPRLTTIV